MHGLKFKGIATRLCQLGPSTWEPHHEGQHDHPCPLLMAPCWHCDVLWLFLVFLMLFACGRNDVYAHDDAVACEKTRISWCPVSHAPRSSPEAYQPQAAQARDFKIRNPLPNPPPRASPCSLSSAKKPKNREAIDARRNCNYSAKPPAFRTPALGQAVAAVQAIHLSIFLSIYVSIFLPTFMYACAEPKQGDYIL